MQKFEVGVHLWLQDAIEASVKRSILGKIKRNPKFGGIEPEWINLTVKDGLIEVNWAFKEFSHQFDHEWIVGMEYIPVVEAVRVFLNEPSYSYLNS